MGIVLAANVEGSRAAASVISAVPRVIDQVDHHNMVVWIVAAIDFLKVRWVRVALTEPCDAAVMVDSELVRALAVSNRAICVALPLARALRVELARTEEGSRLLIDHVSHTLPASSVVRVHHQDLILATSDFTPLIVDALYFDARRITTIETLVTAVRDKELAFAVASAKGVVGKAKSKTPRTHWQGPIDHLPFKFASKKENCKNEHGKT